MANEEHLAILRQGVEVWNRWRQGNQTVKPDLSGINLRNAELSRANFSATDFSYTNLSHADLSHTNFSGAILRDVNFSHALIYQVNFSGANLLGAIFSHMLLIGVDFTNSQMGWTTFGDIELNEVKGLETVEHRLPSSVGIDTIYRSKGKIPNKFLLDAGVPKDDIPYLLSLARKAIDFYSCFISYSSQDQSFAERLHADLQAKGVRTWYAPEDLTIGEPFLLGIDKGIRLHDKLLLVLSQHSIGSGWVQHEVLSALAKEQGKEPWVLFPVRLDDIVLQTSVPWANMIRQSRHIGDFTQWKDHDAYQKSFDRLLRDLKAEATK